MEVRANMCGMSLGRKATIKMISLSIKLLFSQLIAQYENVYKNTPSSSKTMIMDEDNRKKNGTTTFDFGPTGTK